MTIINRRDFITKSTGAGLVLLSGSLLKADSLEPDLDNHKLLANADFLTNHSILQQLMQDDLVIAELKIQLENNRYNRFGHKKPIFLYSENDVISRNRFHRHSFEIKFNKLHYCPEPDDIKYWSKYNLVLSEWNVCCDKIRTYLNRWPQFNWTFKVNRIKRQETEYWLNMKIMMTFFGFYQ